MQGFPKVLQPFGLINKSTRTSNQTLGAGDSGSFIDITSGTFTQTFGGSITNGWNCFYRNSGTGDITIPSSDGVSNWIMYPNETRLFQYTDGVFTSFVITSFSRTFTSSGTFTKPPGYARFRGILWGGGSAGNVGGGGTLSTGGGGGGSYHFTLFSSAFGATETITIGAGGSTAAAHGGTSSIGTLASVYSNSGSHYGGGTVLQSWNYTLLVPAAAHEGTGGSGILKGFYGGGAAEGSAASDSGGSLWGGAAGGGVTAGGVLRAAGTSQFGGNGGAAGAGAANGTDGTAPAGGGGATQTGTQGNGARGELRIWGDV